MYTFEVNSLTESGANLEAVKRMSVCTLSVPVSSLSPGGRRSTFGGAGILGCVPITSNTDEDVSRGKDGSRRNG